MTKRSMLILRRVALCAAGLMLGCGDTRGGGHHAASASDAGDDHDLGPTESSVQVRTRAGVVHGKLDGQVRAFLGIPYAQAPVGELRWRTPEPAAAWRGERDASALPSVCPQLGSGDEDCLYLNVWAPDVELDAEGPLRPTMVWLHGGAFVAGSANLHDGAPLAQRGDVVLVAVNYRLGALGFLAHPALSNDPAGRGSSGNYGLEDQLLALQWVEQNIRAFGGDPDNVTLFGESAGSACTCALLGTPAAHGLVDRAIMESGACLGFESSLEDAEARGMETVADIGCEGQDALVCLREKSMQAIVNASSDLIDAATHQRWRPILDGVVLPKAVDIEPVKVPIIIGTNRNEGGQFGLLAPTAGILRARVADYYPDPEAAARILEAYSVKKHGSSANAFAAMVTDSLFVCPTRHLARVASGAGVDTYMYSFALGAAHHADEVPYVFGLPGLSSDGMLVSEQMLGAWAAFAHTGDPNTGSAPSWPKYERDSDRHMVFDVMPSVDSGLKRAECDLLETLPALKF